LRTRITNQKAELLIGVGQKFPPVLPAQPQISQVQDHWVALKTRGSCEQLPKLLLERIWCLDQKPQRLLLLRNELLVYGSSPTRPWILQLPTMEDIVAQVVTNLCIYSICVTMGTNILAIPTKNQVGVSLSSQFRFWDPRVAPYKALSHA
jgi:hypothetical protein